MNKTTKFLWAVLLMGSVVACKQAENENATEADYDQQSASADSISVISSSAAVEPKNSNRKFVRTADIKFKVKNVAKSTTIIEDTTTKFGGFVTYTNLQSHINEEDKTKVSPDSTLVTTKYTVDNNITIRVPNTQLDTVVKSIAKQIDFLNFRVIKADDVTLQMLSNKMAKKRSTATEKRIATAIDEKGKKLNQVIDAEENLDTKKEQNNVKTIENLSLQDQVNFNTHTHKHTHAHKPHAPAASA